MQKPVKRGNSYRIQVKYKHLRDAATRDTAKECTDWAARRLMELQLQYQEELKKLEQPDIPFSELFTQYYENVGKYKKAAPI